MRADTSPSLPVRVEHDEANHRFTADVNGRTALLDYRRTANTLVLTHTEVPREAEGQGIGSELARAALSYARASGLSVVPRCSFVAAYINHHPEYRDLVK